MQLGNIYLSSSGNFSLGQAFFDSVLPNHIIGIIIFGPFCCFAFSANAINGPRTGNIVGYVLIRITYLASTNPAKTVAAIVTRVCETFAPYLRFIHISRYRSCKETGTGSGKHTVRQIPGKNRGRWGNGSVPKQCIQRAAFIGGSPHSICFMNGTACSLP